jgi:hypothetical protein
MQRRGCSINFESFEKIVLRKESLVINFYTTTFYNYSTVGTLWMWIGDLSLSWHYQQKSLGAPIRLLEFMTDLTNVQFNHKF